MCRPAAEASADVQSTCHSASIVLPVASIVLPVAAGFILTRSYCLLLELIFYICWHLAGAQVSPDAIQGQLHGEVPLLRSVWVPSVYVHVRLGPGREYGNNGMHNLLQLLHVLKDG